MSSSGVRFLSQYSQRERPVAMGKFKGKRSMMTPRNDPMINPKIKTNVPYIFISPRPL